MRIEYRIIEAVQRLTELCSLYTFTVYIGSSIYTPAAGDVMRIFGVGPIAASQGLALFVLAC